MIVYDVVPVEAAYPAVVGVNTALRSSVPTGRAVVEIDAAPALMGQFNRILKDGHHAQPQEINLDDAQVRTIILVPLDDDATGHGGVFQGNDVIQPPLANDHAP